MDGINTLNNSNNDSNDSKTSARSNTKKGLSKRQKDVIRIMAEMEGNPVTVAAISEKLSVSTRTILRDMPVIEKWLSDNDFTLVRRRGKGIAVEECRENISLLLELLDVEKNVKKYSRNDRRTRILGTLFFAVSPVKAYAFTSEYNISEGTLYGDLDVIEKWLEDYRIKMNRRQGLGIFITGEEINRRQAIVNAIFEFFDMNRIPLLLDHFEQEAGNSGWLNHPLVPFYLKEILTFAKGEMKNCEEFLGVTFADYSRISLINGLALAVYRMQHERFIRTMPAGWDKLRISEEFGAARMLADAIRRHFDIVVPEEEIAHFTIYLATSRVWISSSASDDPLKSMSFRNVALSMMKTAEDITDIPFRSDTALIDDLTDHIALMENRILMDTILADSQAAEVRESYPQIYSAAETACQVLKDWIYPKDLKDSDIGFIAMHLAAAAERIQKNARKVVIAVVCPLGIASSKMLAASLLRAFPEIEIRKTTSAFAIDESRLTREGIDLIISTAKINTTFPHIVVDKVLQVQDRMRIQNALADINRQGLQERMNRKIQSVGSFSLDNIRKLAGLGKEIVELLEHFEIVPAGDHASCEYDLIRIAAESIDPSPDGKEKIAKGFRLRKQISDTYLKELEIDLLHCKTDAVPHSRFIYLSLDEPVKVKEGLLKGTVAMTVPENVEDEIFYEPVGKLSSLLVEKPGFLQALMQGDTTASVGYAENALVKYFQHEVTKIMEV